MATKTTPPQVALDAKTGIWTHDRVAVGSIRGNKELQAALKIVTDSDSPEVWALHMAKVLGVENFKLGEDSAVVWKRIDVERFPNAEVAGQYLWNVLVNKEVPEAVAVDAPAPDDRTKDEYDAFMTAIDGALKSRTTNRKAQREVWLQTGYDTRDAAWNERAELGTILSLIEIATLPQAPVSEPQPPVTPPAKTVQPPREDNAPRSKPSTALATIPNQPPQQQRAIDRERFQLDVSRAKYASDLVRTLRQEGVLREGPDFGKVPGTDKDTLFKPGAEKLLRAFRLRDQPIQLDAVTVWDMDRPFFYFRYQVDLVEVETGLVVASGIGSCNSMESKYGYRWVADGEVPPHVDKTALRMRGGRISEPQFAIDKAETGGKYGKPTSYWQAFRDAIDNGTAVAVNKPKKDGGTMKAWEIDGPQYAIVNPDIYSLVNTIDKMAFKRALIAATLIGTNASEHFAQDLEDMPGFGYDANVIEAEIIA